MATFSPDSANIAAAASALRDGQLVAFPTETVYGLGADACNDLAVARIFSAKSRPRFNPLIIHVPDLTTAERYGVFNPAAKKLAQHFWPGALTLVVPLKSTAGLSDLVTAGLDTVAIRVPKHDVAQSLLRAVGRPLAAPSANRSGTVSPTQATHVAGDLDDAVAMILDGGATELGIESTVVATREDKLVLLRPGAVTTNEIESQSGQPLMRASQTVETPHSPGQLPSHYAPNAQVRLQATTVEPGEALLAFGTTLPTTEGPVINLSPSEDTTEAAVNLFAALRTLDATGAPSIAVMAIPETGLGEAINDRLRRAAAPRS